jgi:hypothetical protein
MAAERLRLATLIDPSQRRLERSAPHHHVNFALQQFLNRLPIVVD